MPTLLTLPVELLLQILGALSKIDVKSLFRAQLTCKCMRNLILTVPPFSTSTKAPKPSLQLTINPILTSDFFSLLGLDALKPDTWRTVFHPRSDPHRRSRRVQEAFVGLPWSEPARIRDIYQRPDASWRRIPLSDAAPITRLEFVSILEAITIREITYRRFERIDETHPGLTIGDFYDFLLSQHMLNHPYLRSWRSYVGKRWCGHKAPQKSSGAEHCTIEELREMRLSDCNETMLIVADYMLEPSPHFSTPWLPGWGQGSQDQDKNLRLVVHRRE